jgi:glycosyltransferase involved in cell wall biosynthesis
MNTREQTHDPRVLHVTGNGGGGGIERHIYSLCRLSLAGGPAHGFCALFGPGRESVELQKVGIPVFHLHGRSGHDPRLAWRFALAIKDFRPDVIHYHELHLVPLLISALAFRGPVVYTHHCAVEYLPDTIGSRILWRLAGRTVRLILAVSESTMSRLIRKHHLERNDVRVFYNSVDVNALATIPRMKPSWFPQVDADARIIAGVGRLVPQKDWGLFLDVAREVLLRRRDVEFMILGDGPEEKDLRERVRRENMCGKVHFAGRRDARTCLSFFSAILLTSRDEEMPTVLLESFAAGIPVAGCIPIGGVSEVLSLSPAPVAALIQKRNARLVADKVCEILDDPGYRDTCIRNAGAVVEEHFNTPALYKELMALYQDLISERA